MDSLTSRELHEPQRSQLLDLLEAIMVGETDDSQFAAFEKLLTDHEAARELAVRMLHMHALIERYEAADDTATNLHFPGGIAEVASLESLPSAFPLPPTESPVLGFLGRATTVFNRPVVWSILAVAVLFYGTFALFSWNLRPDQLPRGTDGRDFAVALVSDAGDVKWAPGAAAKTDNSPVQVGETLKINSGLITLQLNSGTTLLVEGPAQWSVDGDNEVTLNEGKLVVRVPKRAVGFSVSTSTVRVIDLGTEFGIEVSRSGQAEVQVFRGQVEVEQPPTTAGQMPSSLPRRVRLQAGQSLTATATSTTLGNNVENSRRFRRSTAASPQEFLDLADIVAGGDGLGHHRERGIDPTTGEVVAFPEKDFTKFGYLLGNDAYHTVADRPLIDGVFVPLGGDQLTQLDSAGHRFQFPKTNGMVFGPVWAGGRIPAMDDKEYLEGIATVLADDIDYAPESRGLISMHPNKGVTFDLEAIRQIHPGRRIIGFTARVGCSAHRVAVSSRTDRAADIWVFVDGKPSVDQRAIERYGQPIALMIPLASDAKFLSLVASDSGDLSLDWVIFGIPCLQLAAEPTKSTD